MTLRVAVLLVASFALLRLDAKASGSSQNAAVTRTENKLQHIEKNGEQAHPERTPTEFTAEEINAYFASGRISLPVGVQSVTFQGQPGVVIASCNVDFDQVKAGRQSASPLLSLFSGVHQVVVKANARGAGGQGVVEVQSVILDGVEVPRFILELFVAKFLQPKYPDVGLESHFRLPDKIDSAIVGVQELIVTQR